MSWGMRTRDPNTGEVLFDTNTEETMFYYDMFTVPLPTTSATVKSYPELAGLKIYVSEVVEVDHPDLDGHPQQALSVSYPNGIPTIRVAPNSVGASPFAYKHVTVMTDGSHNEAGPGTWGARFRNGDRRLTITENLDSYVYLGGHNIVSDGNAKSRIIFRCIGVPVIFVSMESPGVVFDGIAKVRDQPNMWMAMFTGIPLGYTNTMRIFGRMTLNYPGGSDATWGYKQRKADGSWLVTFDSSLRMLALKGYSAARLVNVGNSNTTVPMGFNVEGCSFNGWIYNYRSHQRWVRGSSAGGGLWNWTVTYTTYAYSFVASGSDLLWQERIVARGTGMVQDSYDTSPWEWTYRQPETISFNTILAFIDNARYPI